MSYELCSQQHYYDSGKYPECPFCPPGGSGLEPGSGQIGVEAAEKTPAYDGTPGGFDPPLAWIVVLNGPLRGQDFTVRSGPHYLGSMPTMPVFLDGQPGGEVCGALVYDSRSNQFSLRPGSGRTLAYRNGDPLETRTTLLTGDKIAVGSNQLMFIGLAGEHFRWS